MAKRLSTAVGDFGVTLTVFHFWRKTLDILESDLRTGRSPGMGEYNVWRDILVRKFFELQSFRIDETHDEVATMVVVGLPEGAEVIGRKSFLIRLEKVERPQEAPHVINHVQTK